MRRIQKASLAAAGVLLLAAPAASAQDSVDSGPLTDGVKLRGLVEHQLNLQNIADFGTGTRATGTPGYEASVDYVETRLERAGYNVRREPFNFPTWQENSPPVLRFGGTTYGPGTAADDDSPDVDFITFEFSGSGDLTGVPVVPTTDVQVNPNPGGSTSGCEDADFPAATEGAVSLVQRGTCGFAQKLANAEQAGAVGVILFNEGNGTGRSNALYRTAPVDFPIPAVLSSYAVGVALSTAYAAGQNPTVDLSVDATSTPRYFDNVIAESRTGDPRKKVMLGAHLDSVPAGPGINDNGSGTAALLEIAEEMSKLTRGRANRLTNQVAFAFWGAEESGLIGSTDFVKNLSPGQKARILANLNFDMLGSPNYARFIYDGDGDAFGTTGPARLGRHRGALRGLVRLRGARQRADGVRRPLGLRAVHRGRDPGRRSVHGRGGGQDRGAGGALRRRRGLVVRPVLPPGLRHAGHGARQAPGRRRRAPGPGRRERDARRRRRGAGPDGRRGGAHDLGDGQDGEPARHRPGHGRPPSGGSRQGRPEVPRAEARAALAAARAGGATRRPSPCGLRTNDAW